MAMIESGKVPFRVESNPPLQDLLTKLIRGCSLAYSQLDLDAMDRFYGPDRKSRPQAPHSANFDSDPPSSSPPRTRARARAIIASDDEMSQASDDEALEKALERDGDDQLHPTSIADLCNLGTFLSNPRNLTKLFAKHWQDALDIDDKAHDQFSERRHEDIFVVPEHKGSRGIATLSTSASFASGEGLYEEGLPEHDQFGSGWNSGADAPLPSSSAGFRAKKRGRSQPSSEAEDGSGNEEIQRQVKRLKGKEKGKGKRKRTRS